MNTQKQSSDWEEALQVEVMEDYILDSEGMSSGETKTQYMREHFDKLKDFIRSLLLQAKEELLQEVREKIEEIFDNIEVSCVDDRLLGRSDEYLDGYNKSTERWRKIRDSVKDDLSTTLSLEEKEK